MLRGGKGDSTVDVNKFRAAAASGPLAELIAKQCKVASLARVRGVRDDGPV